MNLTGEGETLERGSLAARVVLGTRSTFTLVNNEPKSSTGVSVRASPGPESPPLRRWLPDRHLPKLEHHRQPTTILRADTVVGGALSLCAS